MIKFSKIILKTNRFVLLILCLSNVCIAENNSKSTTMSIFTSNYPLSTIVRFLFQNQSVGPDGALGSEQIQINYLAGDSDDCGHNYNLTPKDMVKLTKADFLILIGSSSEIKIKEKIINANKNIKVISFEHLIEKNNPHIWLSLIKAPQIAEKIVEKISPVLNDREKQVLVKNLEQFRLKAKQMLEQNIYKSNYNVLLGHGAFAYLINEIKLNESGKIANVDLHNLSMKELISVSEKAQKDKVKVLISEKGESQREVLQISKKLNIPVVQFDTISVKSKNPNQFFDVIGGNLTLLKSKIF